MAAIKIAWKGEAFSIKETDVFELGEQIEDIISLADLAKMAKAPNFRRIARCYAVMINFAGGHVTAKEIHSEMMVHLKAAGEGDKMALITSAITTLLEILMDGAPTEEETTHAQKKHLAAL